ECDVVRLVVVQRRAAITSRRDVVEAVRNLKAVHVSHREDGSPPTFTTSSRLRCNPVPTRSEPDPDHVRTMSQPGPNQVPTRFEPGWDDPRRNQVAALKAARTA